MATDLVIQNLPLPSTNLVTNISEFAANHPLLTLDATLCAPRCQLTVLGTHDSQGRAMLRTRLIHTLRGQTMGSKCFSVWWAVASDVQILERSLLAWCDALDTSRAVSLWPTHEAMRVLRGYPEQQRQWGKCCVLVLDECTNVALLFYLQNWCPRWGLQLYVLGQEPIDMTTLQLLVPSAFALQTPRPLPLQDSDDASMFTDDELLSDQFRNCFGPKLMAWVDKGRRRGGRGPTSSSSPSSGSPSAPKKEDLGSSSSGDDDSSSVDEDPTGGGDDDDDDRERHDMSYVNKTAALVAFRPVLLRFYAVYMQLQPATDTYTAYNNLRNLATEAEAAAGDYTNAAIRLLRNTIRAGGEKTGGAVGGGGDDAAVLMWFDAAAFLPLLFPRSFLPIDTSAGATPTGAAPALALWLRLGVATTVPAVNPRTPAEDTVKLASWFQRRLAAMVAQDAAERIATAIVARCTVLCTLHPLQDDEAFHSLHEQLLLATVPVPSAIGGQAAAVAGDIHSSLVPFFNAAKRDEAKAFGLQYTNNYFLASLRRGGHGTATDTPKTVHAGFSSENPSFVMRADDLDAVSPSKLQSHRRQWLRWGPVILHAAATVIRTLRLFVEIPALYPPRITRPFRNLTGVPALPASDALLTPQLAQLFRLYARAHAAANDCISAASAMERALCIYIGLFEAQAEHATSTFAELLRTNVLSSEMTRGASMRKSSMVGGGQQRRQSAAAVLRPGGGVGGAVDGAPFGHVFSLISLVIEDCYHEAALLYIHAGMAGVAESMVQRGASILELLHNNRRDTPARAVGHARRAEVLLALGDMEEKRGSVIKHAEYLDEDTSEMKLKERVRADVEARTYFRSAAAEASEALAALGRYHGDYLVSTMASMCDAITARQQLSDYNVPQGLEGAEKALLDTKVKIEREPALRVPELDRLRHGGRSTSGGGVGGSDMPMATVVQWAHQTSACFIRAIQLGEYSYAHELLDRCPLLAVLGCLAPSVRGGAPDAVPVGSLLQAIVVESEAADLLSDCTYPTPRPSEHLGLRTTFSDYEVASHHGRCWKTAPRMYCLPAHELLLQCAPEDEAAGMLLRRLLHLGYNQRCCSPHDMRTLLHIAVDRNLHAVAQSLLRHPTGNVLYTAPHCLASQRIGLSTVPTVSKVANTVPAALFACRGNPQLLLALLFEGANPPAAFEAGRVFICEQLSNEKDRGMLMRLVLGKGAPFEATVPLLLDEPALSTEAKEEVTKLCSFRQVETALLKRGALVPSGFDADPYITLMLCDRAVHAAPSVDDATRVLVEVATKVIRCPTLDAKSNCGSYAVLLKLLRKHPQLLSEATLYWDDVKTLEKLSGMRLPALQVAQQSD